MKDREYYISCKIININKEDKKKLLNFYNNCETKNKFFKKISKLKPLYIEDIRKIYSNKKDIKNDFDFLLKTFLSFLNKASIQKKLKFKFEIFSPIYSNEINNALKKEYQKEYLNKPIDWNEEIYEFNSGFKFKPLKKYSIFNNKKFLEKLNPYSFLDGNIFYDCNIPKEIEGYQLFCAGEDLWKYELKFKTYNFKEIIKNLNNKEEINYLEWKINENSSLKYFINNKLKIRYILFIKNPLNKNIFLSQEAFETFVNELKIKKYSIHLKNMKK